MFGLFGDPLKKGIEFMRRKEFEEARDYFQALIEKNIEAAEAHFNLGKCFFRLNALQESKKHFHLALDLKPQPSLISGILEVTNWRMLCPNRYFNGWPVFSPDGKKLAFTSVRRDANGDGKMNALDPGGIYLLALDTGAEQCVVSDAYNNSQPVFSPDGRKMAYLSVRQQAGKEHLPGHGAHASLFVLDLGSGTEKKLLEDTFRTKYHVFSPDSRKLLFTCWRPGDKNSGIYAVDIETGQMETIVPGAHENTFPSISRKGDLLLFSSWRSDTNKDGVIDFHDNSGIYVKRLVDGREITVADERYNNTFPSFSADGTKVLYLSVRRDTNNDGRIDSLDNAGIYLHDLKNGKEKCLVDDSFFNKFASLTPDGNRVVFVSNWRTHRSERKDYFENKGVYVLDIARGQVSQVVSDKYYGSRSTALSPDGGSVAYVSWREGTSRGLYLAYLGWLPGKEELHQWIDRNI
ncbi:MAG: tetratricopeptide repeat protein [Endomicrobiales bacterium]